MRYYVCVCVCVCVYVGMYVCVCVGPMTQPITRYHQDNSTALHQAALRGRAKMCAAMVEGKGAAAALNTKDRVCGGG